MWAEASLDLHYFLGGLKTFKEVQLLRVAEGPLGWSPVYCHLVTIHAFPRYLQIFGCVCSSGFRELP